MQIQKLLINDLSRFLNVSWKRYIPMFFDFVVIHPWKMLFFVKVAFFLTNSKQLKNYMILKCKIFSIICINVPLTLQRWNSS